MSKIGVIGGIIANIESNPYGQIVNGNSNSSTIYMSFSGTGRNMAENLAKIGENVMFVSAAGDDFSGRGAVRELAAAGADADGVKLLPGENTAAYMSVLNIVGELEMAFCNMDVLGKIEGAVLEDSIERLKGCSIVAMDAHPGKEALAAAAEALSNVPLFLDPVSVSDAEKVKDIVGRFHTIKPNRGEAEVLSGLTILSEEELEKAGEWFVGQGVKRVFITLSGGGVYYTDGGQKGFMRPAKIMRNDGEGAGDAFSAAVLSGFSRGYDMKTTTELAMAAASIAIEAKNAVNPDMNAEVLAKRCRESFPATLV